jgi:O-antigen/teichoic acid export membrane protein
MGRLKNFTHALVSGYAQMAVNVVYTLVSVPMALHYLSKAEFGLWALTLQVANFIALVDLGMGSSIARILIDHKDDRHDGRYGTIIKSGFLVGSAQGLVVLAAGLSGVWFLAGWMNFSGELARPFTWLMIGQVLLTAAMFGTRMFGQVLYAWQRIDISNYSAIIQLVVAFAALWMGFYLKFGVFSFLLGSGAGWVAGTVFNAWACVRLRFWPKAEEWGAVSRKQFRELFNYGADVFVISIGTQLIISSQVILVSRQLGVEAAALWSVMTKMFTLVSQVVWRMVGSTMPAFGEMQARREWDRLWDRYRAMFISTNVFACICAVLYAACNKPFVELWTQGKFSWPPINNILLAIWLIISTQQCCHTSIIMCLKEIRTLKYVFILEGIVFIAAGLFVLPSTGITGLLVCSVLATISFTWLSGVWRIAQISKMGWKRLVWDWQKPLIWLLLTMVPTWLVLDWFLHDATNGLRLVGSGGILAAVGVWVAIHYALPSAIVVEITQKLPPSLQQLIKVLNKL